MVLLHRRTGAVVLTLVLALLVAACGGGGGTTKQPTVRATATQPPRATPTVVAGTPTASTGNEAGQPPIFWRTADNFQSVQAGQAYKVLFRITNGYADPALQVTAACQTCATASQREPIAFEGIKSEPQGQEAPGSYYPVNITLPFAGTWRITIVAGSDQAQITVDAAAGESAG